MMSKYAAYKHPNMYRYFKLNASDSTLVKNDFLVRALFCSSHTIFNERYDSINRELEST